MLMDNVLSNIIDSYAKLKDLGIHVDASKIEERIKVYLLENLGNFIPKIIRKEDVQLSFTVKVCNSCEAQIDIMDISFSVNDKKEQIDSVSTYNSDNTYYIEQTVSESDNINEHIIPSDIIKLTGSFGHKKSKNAIENSITKDTEFEKKHSRSDKDTTKYSLNGSEFLPKRAFAHRVIKTFVEQHPDYTYEQLKEIFNDDILRPAWVCKGLLARVEDLLDGSISEKQIDIRYNFSNTELCLKSSDDVEFFVSTQWMRETIEKLILVAEKYGMHCERNENSFVVNKPNNNKPQQRNNRLKINYIIVNGSRISQSNVTDMFVQFVEIVGAEKIFDLKIPINGGYLVDTKIIEKYKTSCKPVGQGLYLFTNRSTETKIKLMEHIANRLNIEVEINTDINK